MVDAALSQLTGCTTYQIADSTLLPCVNLYWSSPSSVVCWVVQLCSCHPVCCDDVSCFRVEPGALHTLHILWHSARAASCIWNDSKELASSIFSTADSEWPWSSAFSGTYDMRVWSLTSSMQLFSFSGFNRPSTLILVVQGADWLMMCYNNSLCSAVSKCSDPTASVPPVATNRPVCLQQFAIMLVGKSFQLHCKAYMAEGTSTF